MSESIVSALADLIARDIFECGDDPSSKCQRIQFLGGKYPDNEKPQGGMCEMALAEAIAKSIDKNFRLGENGF